MFRINEDKTRKETIDLEVEKAGWSLRDHSRIGIGIGIPVTNYDSYQQLVKNPGVW